MDRLKKNSVTGRSRANQKEEPMSPQKLTTLKAIFSERLDTFDMDDKDRHQRAKRMNNLIKVAILNANSQKDELRQLNNDINLAQETQ